MKNLFKTNLSYQNIDEYHENTNTNKDHIKA